MWFSDSGLVAQDFTVVAPVLPPAQTSKKACELERELEKPVCVKKPQHSKGMAELHASLSSVSLSVAAGAKGSSQSALKFGRSEIVMTNTVIHLSVCG